MCVLQITHCVAKDKVKIAHIQQNLHNNLSNPSNTHIQPAINLKSQKQLTNQEVQGKEHEILRKNKKTHTFFLKIEVEMMSNNGDFCE